MYVTIVPNRGSPPAVRGVFVWTRPFRGATLPEILANHLLAAGHAQPADADGRDFRHSQISTSS